ncbi:uncharacterized protein PHACADRAFT_210776 [Phanerochaete carnosa HHB-10118-sp]|uniref:F-box domain-containing protein n=1 Tax=Phanerochaete carnosa (strain HHB-10118-sp) TaxID=650164 RepID=K5W1N9_PHACS|nr:uncharacterized protein PHACADRAFT_210776 [Phanerochaete carnosa HHB-10118-sp]EKM53035.1 hypothetical protein PHACADRAFT_210776 [Phanerochaete carnosa HHB-10118-sp]
MDEQVRQRQCQRQYEAWCWDPGPYSVFICRWDQLPPELHDYIYDILDIIADKHAASVLSLISRVWSRHFRPRLFARLSLWDEEDFRMLYGILRSPLSAWLAEHVATLSFRMNDFPSRPVWTALLRLLPACRCVLHTPDHPSGLVSHSASLKSSLRSITSLDLRHCHFPSFRTLLRVLADITYLETVRLYDVTWSGDAPMAAEAASNICSGSFNHAREVQQVNCTSNLAVAAWILAAASTRYSFARRRTAGPVVPAETWVVIKLIQMFLPSEDTIRYARFDVIEATQDTYKFAGSLSIKRWNVANILCQVVKSAPFDGSDGTWSVHRIALADGIDSGRSRPYLQSRDLSIVSSFLPTHPQLELQILCGGGFSVEEFRTLSEKVMEAVNSHPAVSTKHNSKLPDGRFLEPTLFDVTQRDLEEAREALEGVGSNTELFAPC